MSKHSAGLIAAIGLAALALSPSAQAQKSADTMRVGIETELSHLSIYTHPHPDLSPFYKEVYDPIIRLNEATMKFEPLLAKSWKRTADNMAFDIELRDDVVFHDGKKMTADDAVSTINWSVDEKTKMLFQNRYTSWIKRAEKTGPLTFRLYVIKPTAVDLLRLSSAVQILNGEILDKLENKSDYGAKPVGTGPMKVISFDRGEKVVLERFDGYKVAASAPTKRVHGQFVPDGQTQIAKLLVGEIDVVRNPPADLIKSVPEQRKDIKATVLPSLVTIYLSYDATNRSGAAQPLTDLRVRRAITMAIDRRAIATTFGSAKEKTRTPDTICLPEMLACKVSVKPAAYDPAAAKKLLAEAGFPNGFEIELVTIPLGRDAATVITGYLQAVGIKAKINQITVAADRTVRPSGKTPLYIGTWPGQALPDAHLYTQLFMEQQSSDFSRDPLLTEAGEKGLYELNETKRDEIYRGMFNLINEQDYLLNLMTMDTAYLHATNVLVEAGRAANIFSARLQDFRWAN